MVGLLMNVVHSIVGLTVRFEQPSLEVQCDVQVIHNLMVGLNFDGKTTQKKKANKVTGLRAIIQIITNHKYGRLEKSSCYEVPFEQCKS